MCDDATVQRELVECTECGGDGVVQTIGGEPDVEDGEEPTMADFDTVEVECDHCGGRGTEYDGLGCPRCGAAEDAISSSLMPSSTYKQSCSECGWWQYAG